MKYYSLQDTGWSADFASTDAKIIITWATCFMNGSVLLTNITEVHNTDTRVCYMSLYILSIHHTNLNT